MLSAILGPLTSGAYGSENIHLNSASVSKLSSPPNAYHQLSLHHCSLLYGASSMVIALPFEIGV